jgi:hypothetical protein
MYCFGGIFCVGRAGSWWLYQNMRRENDDSHQQRLSWLSLWCSARWFWLVIRNDAGPMTQSDSARWAKMGQKLACAADMPRILVPGTGVMHVVCACPEFLFWTT